MANCRDIESKLAEYVDGEQSAPERAGVESHFEECPPCRTRAASERAAHDLVCARRQALRAQAPDSLHRRCAAQRTVATPPAAPVLRQRPWLPVSMAATLVLATGLFMLFGWGSAVETYAAQLSADHLKCFQFPPYAAASPDVTLLGQTWQASSGWGLKVPATAIEGLDLLAIRRCGSSRGRVAHILYKWHGQPLSVFVLNRQFDRAPDAGRDHDVNRLGEHAIVWTENQRTYAVVADRRLPDLQRVASYVRHSIE